VNLRVKIAAFPIPSRDYTPEEIKQLARKLNSLIDSLYNPGDLVATSLQFSVDGVNILLPASGYGLGVGTLYYEPITGNVKIVLPDDVFAPSFSMRFKLRDVTVTT